MTRRAPYVPLEVGFWDDPKIVAVGEGAAVLYLRMLCYAKANQTDGYVPWAVIRRWGHPQTAKRRLSRLHSATILEPFTNHSGTVEGYTIVAYLRHNRPATAIAELSHKRRSAGAAGGRATAARASKLLPAEAQQVAPLARSIEVEVETKEPNLNPLTKPGATGPAEIGEDLPAELLSRLGYQRQAVDSGLRRYVDRCIARGWTPVQLAKLADEIADRSDVAEPRQYLLAALKQRANSEPTAAAGDSWADAWAAVRRVTAGGSHSYSERQGLTADAARAANEVRQVIRFEPEHVARLAFRSAYMARNGHRSAA